ncbi:MAG: lysylphosphatidylglycerol synthase transmembrane domain-containing protein [Chloroflexi bacterium]|nr:lysylphosphatidylglycerol synthase transmembrane domain-containing protein [Chloroflexota bacterium]
MRPSNVNQQSNASLKRRLFSPTALLSVALTVAAVALAATRFNHDWGATWESVRSMNPWLYATGFVLYYASFWFRGLRWRMLARNSGIGSAPGARLPSTLECARLILIGWFVNAISWLRLGDAYRAYGFAQDSGSSFSKSLGTMLAERALDMATILALVAVTAVLLTTKHGSPITAYLLVAALVMALGLTIMLLVMRLYGVRLARLLPHRLEQAYHHFHEGTLGSFKNLPALMMLGFAGWALEIARLYFVIQALDLSIGFPLVTLVALGHAILSIAPTPGGVGAVEPGVTGLLVISLARPDAVAVTLLDRSITYVSVIVIGALVFGLRQVGQARRLNGPQVAAMGAEQHGDAGD